MAVVIIGIYSNEKYLTEKENDSLRWFTSRACSERFHCFLIFSLRHQLGVSVSAETYVRGLSRTRQFSSVPTFWLLDCRINRCVERMDTCGEHTYFNVPLSFSFIYNAVSFVVSRMFPLPLSLVPGLFYQKSQRDDHVVWPRSRGSATRKTSTNDFAFFLALVVLMKKSCFLTEALKWNIVNGFFENYSWTEFFAFRVTDDLQKKSSTTKYFQNYTSQLTRLSAAFLRNFRNQTDLEQSRPYAFPLVTRPVLSTSLRTIRRTPDDVSNLRLVRVQPQRQTQWRFYLRRDTMSLNNTYQVTFSILAPVVLPTFLPLQRTSKKKKRLKLKEKRKGAVGEFWGKRSGSGWCFARQSGKKRWRGLVHHVTRGLRWQGRGERPRNSENRGARKWLCTRVHSALAV